MVDGTGIVNEATPQQKAAEVTWLIAAGAQMTTAEIAERYGMTWQGADRLLSTISGRVPIVKEATRWRRM